VGLESQLLFEWLENECNSPSPRPQPPQASLMGKTLVLEKGKKNLLVSKPKSKSEERGRETHFFFLIK
jgi:hypothetical protein